MGGTSDSSTGGGTIDLAGGSRRRFLKGLAAAGAGPAGLRRAVEEVRDDVSGGVPVVWTRDRRGRPDRVRMVPKERYRRLSVFRTLDVGSLRDRHAGVEGVELSGTGDDLSLRVLVDRAGWSARRSLPGRVRRVPVELDESDEEVPAPDRRAGPPAAASTGNERGENRGGSGLGPEESAECRKLCEEHILKFYDPVPAAVQVKGHQGDEVTPNGTLGLVAWNADPRDPYECFVTANHVVSLLSDGTTAEYLFQSGMDGDEPRSEDIGRLREASPLGSDGMDAAKYEVLPSVAAAPLANAGERLPDVSGSWDFAGLADATSGPEDSVAVDFSGRSTCWAESRCTGTRRDHFVRHEAVVKPAVADAGDSGGPFLDDDGKLVCTVSTGPACQGVDHHYGPVGTPLLASLGVALSPPPRDVTVWRLLG